MDYFESFDGGGLTEHLVDGHYVVTFPQFSHVDLVTPIYPYYQADQLIVDDLEFVKVARGLKR